MNWGNAIGTIICVFIIIGIIGILEYNARSKYEEVGSRICGKYGYKPAGTYFGSRIIKCYKIIEEKIEYIEVPYGCVTEGCWELNNNNTIKEEK